MQFEDIVMLDIPDDQEVENSHDELSLESPNQNSEPSKKEYPKLQLWLTNDADLEFCFDLKAYEGSVIIEDEFSKAQFDYVSKVYGIVADLSLKDVNLASIAEEKEHIGVISSNSRDMGGNKDALYKISLINDAFSKTSNEFRVFYEGIKDSITDEEGAAYEDLISVFDCLEATCFVTDERRRPELIALWINNFDPKPENDFIDTIMYNTPIPYQHPQFWTLYLGTLLLRGMFEQAESSLKSCKYEELAELCPELHSIIQDFLTLVSTYTSMALKGQFPEWKFTVCDFRDNFKNMKGGIIDPAHVTIASNLHDLLCLMSGLPKTTASFVSTWYELYAALSLFQVRDDVDVFEDYYQLAIHEKGIDADSPMDEIFRSILTKKYLNVILKIHELDPATAAYVSKLFELKGFFSSYYVDITGKIIENLNSLTRRYVSDYLLTRQAFECFEVHQLVPVAMGILLTPLVTTLTYEQKRTIVATFLPHYKCQTNDDLEWALTICTKLNLPEVVRRLLFKQGEKSLEEGYLFEAMSVLVSCLDEDAHSKESALALSKIHHIVWELLFQDTLLKSSPVPDELLINIITNQVDPNFYVHPLIRQCLSPFAVLTEFFLTLGDDHQMQKNISRLFHLLKFKYLPPKFVPLLLGQFMPLLASAKFEFQHFIIMIDLIDTFELQQVQRANDEAETLYEFAVASIPEDAELDWRVRMQKLGQKIPASLEDLLRELRERIMERIGRLYIGA